MLNGTTVPNSTGNVEAAVNVPFQATRFQDLDVRTYVCTQKVCVVAAQALPAVLRTAPFQASGRHPILCLSCGSWWQVQGSDLGRLSRRFYREPPGVLMHAAYLRERHAGSIAAAARPLLSRKPPQPVGRNRTSLDSWSWAGCEMRPAHDGGAHLGHVVRTVSGQSMLGV